MLKISSTRVLLSLRSLLLLLLLFFIVACWTPPSLSGAVTATATATATATHDQRGEEKKEDENDDDIDIDIEKLLDEMGWKGQLGQMVQIDIQQLLTTITTKEATETVIDQQLANKWIGDYGIGSVLNNNFGWTAADYRKAVIQLQTTAQNYHRPPVIWGLDSIHGANYIRDAVITPQPINLAATFNDTIPLLAGQLASKDTRRAGINWLFSPLLGLGGWNPLWSRTYETFGEDPLLVGNMAQHMIHGIQEKEQSTSSLLPSRAAACGKHWIGYSYPHNGHDRAPSWIPKRHLYQYFLVPWKKVLLSSSKTDIRTSSEKKPMTIMESYTEFNGVPNVANRFSLDQVLRKEMHFQDGMLVTDYNEIYNLDDWHHVASSKEDAIHKVLTEGSVDMAMFDQNEQSQQLFFDTMNKLKDSHDQNSKGKGTTARNHQFQHRVRQSARRILHLKKELHMFQESFQLQPLDEDEIEDEDEETKLRIPEEDIDTVLEMTRQSMILVKNENNALPLVVLNDNPIKVLITGPTSNSLSFQSGGWTGEWQGVNSNHEDEWFLYGSTVVQAMKNEGEVLFDITYECGVDILGKGCNDDNSGHSDNINNHENDNNTDNDNDNNSEDNDVFRKVRKWIHWGNNNDNYNDNSNTNTNDNTNIIIPTFDVIVVCVGEENYAEKPGDIRDLHLPEGQYALVEAVKDMTQQATAQTKIILVYFGGRPRLLHRIVPLVDAVIIGFLPGPFAGTVIAEFLTGRTNPSGKLPLTYPKDEDLGGIPYLHSVSDMCTSATSTDNNNDNDNGDETTTTTLPHYYNVPCDVQWPFGHGLSYTQFTYSDIQLSTTTLQHHWHDTDHDHDNDNNIYDDEELVITVTVTNSGTRDGSESVLFFTFDEFRSTTPEYKRLRGYKKIFLHKGESQQVSLSIPLDDLRFIGPHDETHSVLQDGLIFRVGVSSYSDCRRPDDDDDHDHDHLCSVPITIHTEQDYVGACEAACSLWETSGCATTLFPPSSSTSTRRSTSSSCRNACVSIHDNDTNNLSTTNNMNTMNDGGGGGVQLNNDGWGWTYVSCLESIIWNDQFDSSSTTTTSNTTTTNSSVGSGSGSGGDDCWKLTTFCRDIFKTPGYDEFGNNGNSGHTGVEGAGDSEGVWGSDGSGQGIYEEETTPQMPVIVAIIAGSLASIMIYCIMKTSSGDDDHGLKRHRRRRGDGDVEFTPVNVNEVC